MKTLARPAAALLFLGFLALSACSDNALSVVCPGQERPSLLVTVLDSVSGESVASESRGWWTLGTVTDSLRHLEPSTAEGAEMLAAYGPPGSYDVRVVRPGHPDWIRKDIVVTQGSCGPDARDLIAQFTHSQ